MPCLHRRPKYSCRPTESYLIHPIRRKQRATSMTDSGGQGKTKQSKTKTSRLNVLQREYGAATLQRRAH